MPNVCRKWNYSPLFKNTIAENELHRALLAFKSDSVRSAGCVCVYHTNAIVKSNLCF